ncbi:MAG: alpha/beta fold hydrolase [Byssovorax sp.]
MRTSFLAAIAATALGVACGTTGNVSPNAASGTTGAGGEITGAGGGGDTGGHGGHAGVTTTTTTTTTGSGGQGGAPPKGPPYPIVLAHGFFGFEDFAGAGFLSYFYKVKDHLAQNGEIVLTPAVDPFNDSDFRGDQLITHIEAFLAQTGAAKVNLIGHSQGGLDARAVAHKRPDLIASVITIATPHHGTPIADIALKLLADPNAQSIINALAKLIGGPLYDQIGNETDLAKPLHLFSQAGIAEFNQKHPDAPGVFYASIAGRSALHGPNDDCDADVVVPFMQPWKDKLDAIDPLFAAIGLALEPKSHDGLVRSADARWGEFWGCVPGDHLDEVGQLFGDSPGIGEDWDYLAFYDELVNYLRVLGY